MQTTFVLECEFASSNTKTNVVQGNAAGNNGTVNENQVLWRTADPYELRAYIMYDKVIAFNNTTGSVTAEY